MDKQKGKWETIKFILQFFHQEIGNDQAKLCQERGKTEQKHRLPNSQPCAFPIYLHSLPYNSHFFLFYALSIPVTWV